MPEAGQRDPFAPHAFARFIATTSRSAPRSRIGTPFLAGSSDLDLSLCIETRGSHVPHKSQDRAHAAFMPYTTQPVGRLPLGFIPGQRSCPVLMSSRYFSTRHPRFTFVRLRDPYLTRSRRAFSIDVHHPGHWAGAADGGLTSGPATRCRGAHPHLSCSMTSVSSWPPPDVFVTHARRDTSRSGSPRRARARACRWAPRSRPQARAPARPHRPRS